MRRFLFSPVFFAFLFFVSGVFINAQTPVSNSNNLLQNLLDLPAPRPLSPAFKQKKIPVERLPEFFDKKKPPADDAPLEDILDYWRRQSSSFRQLGYNIKPSEIVLGRILDYCEKEPAEITGFLNVFPSKPEIGEQIKRLYAKFAEEDEEDEFLGRNWKNIVKDWLKYNTNHFSDELFQQAQNIKDENEYLTNHREMLALAKVDWEKAKPILERLENDSSQPISSTLAKWAFYAHAVATDDDSEIEKYRTALQKVVENKSASNGARDLALDALVEVKEWDGRDDWYLTLIEDDTLTDLRINGRSFTGLTTLIYHSPPDKWIPQMTKLVGSNKPHIRQAAIRNLVALLGEKRRDVIEPLLPWLTNPDWAKETGSERSQLIDILGNMDIPESIPGLIWIVLNDDKYSQSAAQSLITYKTPQATPALQAVLAKTENEEQRANYLEALLACGGFSDAEQIAALEAFAVMISTEKGREIIEGAEFREYVDEETRTKPLPLNISLGNFLAKQTKLPDNLLVNILERIDYWQKNNLKVHQFFLDILRRVESPVIDLYRLQQIKNGKADLDTIIRSLAKRRELREKFPLETAEMRSRNGILRGLAEVLLEDEAEMLSVLNQTDIEAQIALLAGARLIRAKLPVSEVGNYLKSANKLLALAAERYLESEDSIEARNLVWQNRPNEAVIVGARTAFVTTGKVSFDVSAMQELFLSVSLFPFEEANYREMTKFENKLREEVKNDRDLREVHTLFNNLGFGQTVIRIFSEKTVLTFYEDKSRYRERVLSKEEITNFRRVFSDHNPDEIPVYQFENGQNEMRQLVSLNRAGGRRTFYQLNKKRNAFEKLFDELLKSDNFKVRYHSEDKVKDLEILFADEKYNVKSIAKTNENFHVLIEDAEKTIEASEKAQKIFQTEMRLVISGESRQEKMEEIRRRIVLLGLEPLSWRKFSAGKLGEKIDEPVTTSLFREDGIDVKLNFGGLYVSDFNEIAKSEINKLTIVAAESSEKRGLWKVTSNAPPVLFKEGNYSKPLLSPDGKFLIAVKRKERLPEQPILVRINLANRQELPISLPKADYISPGAYLSLQNKFLIATQTKNPTSQTTVSGSTISTDAAEEDETNQLDYRMSLTDLAERINLAPPKYFLLDPITGVVSPAKGEFAPLTQQRARPLQPTNNPNEFWAAIPNEKKGETNIGTYDMKTFTFKVWRTLPNIVFESKDLYADEKNGKFYFIYKGHLLALPFKEIS